MDVSEVESFDDMDLDDLLLRGIYAYGFEKPSVIQKRVIRPVIDGYDVIAQAQSGTGKTASYIIGGLQRIDVECKHCQILVIAPTRELSAGIERVAHHLGTYVGLSTAYTGSRIPSTPLNEAQFIVGTPGSIKTSFVRDHINLEHLKLVVVDEVELSDRGVFPPIIDLLRQIKQTTASVQLCFFLETTDLKNLQLADLLMDNPILIRGEQPQYRVLQGCKLFYINVEREEWKLDTLMDLFGTANIAQAVIYCNTSRKVDWLADKLLENDFSVSSCNNRTDDMKRKETMEAFQRGEIRLLVTTILLGHPKDFSFSSLRIHYDLPRNIENFLHTAGRSRCNNNMVISLVTEMQSLREIEQFYSIFIPELPVDFADQL
eukprot:CAMPEP_0206184402 /NCGR_PEP_ID=MMETSP0166-20121206/1198_1 /ASSEMBLY_ACC=CAM_ASM_000260 /TAXON_ID=95228 /ORGANISM="Vannella robusta, Strain DIVA3 518/3/11/1/6" /LENGTH=374 /DNA_ID=CAMNT_0053599413 /DNA_START=334 /DNA_END=1461 /DNA_ORIENTATION=-